MLCDYCHKQEAIIHLQEISPDGNRTLNLCPECAIKRLARLAPGFAGLESALASLRDLIQGKDAKVRLESIFGGGDKTPDNTEMDPKTTCPTCHKTMADFLQDNQLGCQDCAKAFAPYIKTYLENKLNVDLPPLEHSLSNAQQPKPLSQQKTLSQQDAVRLEVERLREQLRCAIKSEDYHKAAQLRDLIAEFTPEQLKEDK